MAEDHWIQILHDNKITVQVTELSNLDVSNVGWSNSDDCELYSESLVLLSRK